MERPYVICHMTTSLDGKVTGEHLRRNNHSSASEVYYEINRAYKADAYACGRITMAGSFTGGWYPDLNGYSPAPGWRWKMDHIPEQLSGFYAVAFDPHGRLGWQSDRIVDVDKDPGYDKAQIIEVLTHDIDPRYTGFLEKQGIAYIFAGETEIDMELALLKLRRFFGIQKLLLEGGSILNGAFQRAGVIDELSLVVDPVIGGEGKSLCMNSRLEEYRLIDTKHYNGILWINCRRNEA